MAHEPTNLVATNPELPAGTRVFCDTTGWFGTVAGTQLFGQVPVAFDNGQVHFCASFILFEVTLLRDRLPINFIPGEYHT